VRFIEKNGHISETAIINNRKWHTPCQTRWKSSTLYDLEGQWQPVRSAILATSGLSVTQSV